MNYVGCALPCLRFGIQYTRCLGVFRAPAGGFIASGARPSWRGVGSAHDYGRRIERWIVEPVLIDGKPMR